MSDCNYIYNICFQWKVTKSFSFQFHEQRYFEEDEGRVWCWYILQQNDQWIYQKETKNLIYLQINFNNSLFVDLFSLVGVMLNV